MLLLALGVLSSGLSWQNPGACPCPWHPCLPCHDCPASAEAQPGPWGAGGGWGEGEASAKLLPVPGSQVESQAGKCSLQALGWAVEKQLRIGGCRAKMGFPRSSAGKESACNVGDLGSIPGLGRLPGEGKGYPLQD